MTRLEAIEALAEPAGTIADVGCDHGKVAGFLAASGLADKVIASDISEACLDKARRTLVGAKGVEFIACDGIGYACDEAVIAGMGGALICDILSRAHESGRLPATLILCPHRDAHRVRSALVGYGYAIDSDVMIKERGKFYWVLRAHRGGGTALTELQCLFGVDYERESTVLREYLQKLFDTYGIAAARNADKLDKVRAAMRAQGMIK